MRRCSTSFRPPVFLVGLLALGVILTGCTGSQNSRSSAQLRIVEGLDRPPFTPDSLVDRPDSLYFRSESPHRAVQIGDEDPARLDVEVVGSLSEQRFRRALHLTTTVPGGVTLTPNRAITIRTDSTLMVYRDAWRVLQQNADSLVAHRRVPLDATALHHVRLSDSVTVTINERSYALSEPVIDDLENLMEATPNRLSPDNDAVRNPLTAPLDEPLLEDKEIMRPVGRNITYPRIARQQKIEGVVRVEFVIRKNGSPTRLQLTQRAHPFLDKAALDAIRRTTFNPVRVGGTRINLAVSVPITFRLEPDRMSRNAP
jgi:protein TonB